VTSISIFGATTDEGERHGVSVFLRDGDNIYRTYYTGARGGEYLGSHWTYLDLTPFGRQETWEDSSDGWLRLHDEYGKLDAKGENHEKLHEK
jgi:predicted dithiol-disulfide oxidoreductase (DUF899 family)